MARETWQEKNERLQNSPRLRAINERLLRVQDEDVAGARQTLRALHLLVIDATLDGDTYALDAAVHGLQAAANRVVARAEDSDSWRLLGRVEALSEEALLALERVPSLRALADYEPESHSARFLRTVAENPGASNLAIAAQLDGVTEQRVSQIGRELSQRGFARKRRVGRANAWDLTPRGAQMLQLIEAGEQDRPQREHRASTYS